MTAQALWEPAGAPRYKMLFYTSSNHHQKWTRIEMFRKLVEEFGA
jgi:hypothetical protein